MAVKIELHLDHIRISDQLEEKVRKHIEQWSRGHHDITGAFVSLKQLSGKKTVNLYEVKIVLYRRPGNLVTTHRSSLIPDAFSGAVHAAERQLRETRAAYRDRRKRQRVPVEEE